MKTQEIALPLRALRPYRRRMILRSVTTTPGCPGVASR
jgi:hypothetical protein